VTTKNQSKPTLLSLNAYQHTFFDVIPQYKEAQYKFYQTKIDKDAVLCMILHDQQDDIRHHVNTLHTRRFKNSRKLFIIKSETVYEKLYTGERPFLYQLKHYLPITDHEQLDYLQEEIVNNPEEYRQETEGIYMWSSQKLINFLYNLILPDIDFMVRSLGAEDLGSYYLMVFPEIKSYRIRNIHVREKKSYQTAFDLYFASNLYIPEHISIGHQISIGHGVITPI